ncbi:DoxX family protein [Pedobacter sp. AW31-3R]|uniref:DoxX family protein n=1 Tax=Pedobacter sp. AW31-3R TaxID=3445781 RepID=UPI003F9FB1BF
MNKTVFLLLRLAVAASMFGHGLVRLPKLAGFSAWMVGDFAKSMIPQILVVPFSYALPVAEFIIGLFLFIGLFTRISLIAGAVVMVMLIFGSCMVENFNAIPSQLIHAAFFAILLQFIEANSYCLDRKI